MSAASSSNQTPTAFHRFAERLVFGNRPVVLILFALITAVLTFFASQLRVDAGFKKQIPLQHEYMKTFIDYEQEFGGANRVLIAVMDKSGDMFNLPFFQTMEKITQDAKAIENITAVLAANGGHWKGLDDLELATCGWVAWFNEDRIHGELDDRSPAEVEAAHYRSLGQAHAA